MLNFLKFDQFCNNYCQLLKSSWFELTETTEDDKNGTCTNGKARSKSCKMKETIVPGMENCWSKCFPKSSSEMILINDVKPEERDIIIRVV